MATLQKLTYRFTLDAFKSGNQRILQGWVTGETIVRKLEISLQSGTEPYELPLEGVSASMYVTTPNGTLSINACTIDAENNKVIYEVLSSDIQQTGFTTMQLKLFDNENILISPSFQLEVWESTISDSQAVQSPTYTALTAALAEAEAYADKAIEQVYIDDDYTFVIEMADGTEYTSSALKDCLSDCEAEALKAEGWAVGKQDGEDVTSGSPYYQNNAKYYSGQANGYKNMAENAKQYAYEYANDALGYKNDASGYKDQAYGYVGDAHAEVLLAQAEVVNAHAEAVLAESYAVGGTNTRTGEDNDNSKYYKERCEQIAASLEGGFIPMGTVLFANLPTENIESGWMYNVSDSFTSDSRFEDGGGIEYPAGTNVYYTAQSKWDCLSAPYQTAGNTTYDNTESGLAAENVQDAVDELKGITDDIEEALTQETETVTGNPLSFSTDSAQVANSTVITFEPIQAGSGDASPNNVRTISGYDAIRLKASSKNLVFNKIENAVISSNGIITTNTNYDSFCAFVESGKTYTALKQTTVNALVAFYTKYPVLGSASYNGSITLEINSDTHFSFVAPITGYAVYVTDKGFNKGQVAEGDITTYEKPITDISEDLDETRYGFTFDVESGELTIYKGFKTYNGSENWEQSANPNACRIPVPSDMDTDNPDAICDTYTYTTTPNDVNYGFAIGSYIAVKDVTNCSTVADFKTYLSGHNITFVYKLKNPIKIILSAHSVKLLNGANVVTSNGTSIDLVYKTGVGATLADLEPIATGLNSLADYSAEVKERTTKTENNITPNHETTDTASKAYKVGEHFTNKDGDYCIVTSAISSGGTLTKNTNYVVTNIGEENRFEAVTLVNNDLTNATGNVYFLRIGRVVTMICDINVQTSGTTITTAKYSFPNNFKPAHGFFEDYMYSTTHQVKFRCYADSGANVNVQGTSGTTTVNICKTITYIAQ